jgi:acetyl-CoA/propionyl-CoA carboxylase biotin carboxyl carrier protein
VTELVTGWDLVEWQVRIAAGEKLTARQNDVTMTGHAIEARVYAEDPAAGFLPTGGPVLGLREPSGPAVRVDSGLSVGMTVGSDYDPMLSKVIAHGTDRPAALRTLDRALAETAVLGVGTNIEFLRFLLAEDDVAAGRLDTGLIDRTVYTPAPVDDTVFIAAAAYRWLRRWPARPVDLWDVPSGWRVGAPAATAVRLRSGERTAHVHITGTPDTAVVTVEDSENHTLAAQLNGDTLVVTVDGIRAAYTVAADGHQIWLAGQGRTLVLDEVREASVRADDEHSGDAELLSPMPGSVVAVTVADGDSVGAGSVVVVVEAMKMEHSLAAPVDGAVELLVAVGDQVKVGQLLARITATTQEKATTDE